MIITHRIYKNKVYINIVIRQKICYNNTCNYINQVFLYQVLVERHIMENIKVVLEDIKSMRNNVKGLVEKADRLEKAVWTIKESSRKEKNLKKKNEYKDIIEEINLQLYGLKKDIEILEDADLFRDKVKIPKHTK